MAKNEVELFTEDENKQRGNWSSKLDFLLSMLGYAVGLGNVWRFPYVTYESGGGAFLIPYFLMLFLAGFPLYFMEESIGQYCSLSPIRAWDSVPALRGVAIGAAVANFLTSITYAVVITYCFFYLFASFTTYLPWSDCNNYWNTVYCETVASECLNQSSIVINNGSCYHPSDLTSAELEYYNVSETSPGLYDLTYYNDPLVDQRVSASEEYWTRRVRRESSAIGDTGGIVWELAGCLLVTYTVVFLSLARGIKSSGKVVYFTATFPYVVLVALFCLGMTLPGHEEGISFFITPRWELLSEPRIWMTAAIQIFYSVGISWGGIVTLSSYNKFHNNSLWDSTMIPIANCVTSVFSGFAIFSLVGYMAHELNQPVESVVAEGYGLAFIAYPTAFNLLPAPTLWSILFFGMLLTLGLDSTFASIETTVTCIVDHFPPLRKRKIYVTAATCLSCFLFGLLYVTEAGPYWATLMDQSAAGFQILMFAILECSAISWQYGLLRFKNDIRSMLGDKSVDNPFFLVCALCWCFIIPALLSFILMFNWLNWTDVEYNGPYPLWAIGIGWFISGITLVWIPVVWVYEYTHTTGNLLQRWYAMTSPRQTWGPAIQEHRDEAWVVHLNHGTTMGGRLKLNPNEESSLDINGDVTFEKPRTPDNPKFMNKAFQEDDEMA